MNDLTPAGFEIAKKAEKRTSEPQKCEAISLRGNRRLSAMENSFSVIGFSIFSLPFRLPPRSRKTASSAPGSAPGKVQIVFEPSVNTWVLAERILASGEEAFST